MHKNIAEAIGKKAAKALWLEVFATPKPGLVDRENSGAHRDMDYPLFLASIEALRDYFCECTFLGMKFSEACDNSAMNLCQKNGCKSCCAESDSYLDALRKAGLGAEKAMFSATGGVNTHKGAVFSMGILCSCLGQMAGKNGIPLQETDRELLRKRCAKLAAALLGQTDPDDTNGAAVYRDFGCGGIREEALSGFSNAFQWGFPALKEALAENMSVNNALVKTLLVLMTKVFDSNAVHRGGMQGLSYIRNCAGEILAQTDFRTEESLDLVKEFDRQCICRNLSPGGSADLLSLSVMLYMVFETGERKI